MMIIGRDNLARETVAEKLVVGGIPDTEENRLKAGEFCTWLNSFSCTEDGGTYHTIELDDNYRLSRGMEDMV